MDNNKNTKSDEFINVNSIQTDSDIKSQKQSFKKYTEKNSSGFGKSIMLPFLCGMLGAGIVIGTCFGVPSIRQNIFSAGTTTNTKTVTDVENLPNYNTDLISLSNFSDTSIAVANKVLPSIVGIQVEYSVNSIFSRNTSTATAEGSGVIITNDGYILTNNHVVSTESSNSNSFYEVGKANKISVYLYNDETPYEAKVIGTDEQTDLAVIKIEKDGLTAAELGDSDGVQVGEFCMAIGNPLGMKSSVTDGIISALNRQLTDSDGKTYTLMQTNAAINGGNSGGALVNSQGQVIGINTIKVSGTGVEGLGFAIPINSTKTIYSDLVQYNKVRRPYIGISGMDLDEETAKRYNLVVGVYIRAVEDISPAQKADIRNGDVIIEADGKKVTNMNELNEIKNTHQIGDKMKIKLNRDGKEKEVEITLAEQP